MGFAILLGKSYLTVRGQPTFEVSRQMKFLRGLPLGAKSVVLITVKPG